MNQRFSLRKAINPFVGFTYCLPTHFKRRVKLIKIISDTDCEVQINEKEEAKMVVKKSDLYHLPFRDSPLKFGQYKGFTWPKIVEVDDEYLNWSLINVNFLCLSEQYIAILLEINPSLLITEEALDKNELKLKTRQQEIDDREWALQQYYEEKNMEAIEDSMNSYNPYTEEYER
jgi:hypothetical protein